MFGLVQEHQEFKTKAIDRSGCVKCNHAVKGDEWVLCFEREEGSRCATRRSICSLVGYERSVQGSYTVVTMETRLDLLQMAKRWWGACSMVYRE